MALGRSPSLEKSALTANSERTVRGLCWIRIRRILALGRQPKRSSSLFGVGLDILTDMADDLPKTPLVLSYTEVPVGSGNAEGNWGEAKRADAERSKVTMNEGNNPKKSKTKKRLLRGFSVVAGVVILFFGISSTFRVRTFLLVSWAGSCKPGMIIRLLTCVTRRLHKSKPCLYSSRMKSPAAPTR